MQLSAANLLLAAQQSSRQASQPDTKQFASALAAEARKDELFAPLDFKQAAPAPQSRPAPSPGAALRPGTTLDIRV